MIDKITINGVTYHVTPTTAPQLGDQVVTIDGVIYIIGEPLVEAQNASGDIERARVGGQEYDIRDAVLLPLVQQNATAIANETQRAEKAEKDIAGNLNALNFDVAGNQSDILNIRNQAARVDGNAFSATKNEVKLTSTGVNISNRFTVSLPSATTESAGVMSAEDKKKLDNLSEGGGSSGGGDVNVAWTSSSKMNNFVIAGIYNIKGERTMSPSFDNLPIYNSGGGHTISARLEVLDSSINDTTNSDDKCITQKLTLSNRVGGDGNVYIRTGRGRTLGSITWEPWATLQPNINVGEVRSLDNFVDNGIYSGVWTDNFSSFAESFVMITINDYAVAGDDKTVVQIKYAYDTFSGNGVPTFTTRSLRNETWGGWMSIGVGTDTRIAQIEERLTQLENRL